jgi:hypothetical protein
MDVTVIGIIPAEAGQEPAAVKAGAGDITADAGTAIIAAAGDTTGTVKTITNAAAIRVMTKRSTSR